MIAASIALAIVFMGIAHMVRTLRWELFIGVYEKPDRKRLYKALSFGYLINYFVPYKLGDIARGYSAGKRMKNGCALGFSTVIMDRYLDVLAVGFIFLVLRAVRINDTAIENASRFYIIFFLVLLTVTVLIYVFRGALKKLIRVISGLFNTEIETSIMFTAWALIWNFKDILKKISKIKLVAYTIGMWSLYLLSYVAFGWFYTLIGTQTEWIDIFLLLFGENGVKASTLMLSLFDGEFDKATVSMVAYMVAPLVLLWIISLLIKNRKEGSLEKQEYINLLPQLNPEERLLFLDRYFSNENKDYIENYLKISRGISIVRDYSAGSNATTMLCIDEKGTFFRKYAFSDEGRKLNQQIDWLEAHCNDIPLTGILRKDYNGIYCYYDMPYVPDATGFFEYLHSMPADAGWHILKNVFNRLEDSLYSLKSEKASPEMIHTYIDEKVIRNINRIKESKKLKEILDSKTVFINGKEYNNLSFYEKYLNENYLSEVFSDEEVSYIHGDLTVENIVCKRTGNRRDDFYLIDPNTGNILDSPDLDYAKMLQSLHGGYEFLMSVKTVNVNENHIDFLFAKSFVYSDIWRRMDAYICDKYSEKRVKSIYFHEIVHWLRLMPYKIEKDHRTAYAFYAGMLMVMDDIFNRFEK